MWRYEYLASLREASPYHKTSKNQIQVEPRKSEVALIKEDKITWGMWKLGKIEKLNRGGDGNVRTVIIYLSNGHYVQSDKYLQAPEEGNQVSDQGMNIHSTLGVNYQSERQQSLQGKELMSF